MEPLDIYALIQPIVQKEIDDKIAKYANDSMFRVIDIPAHFHNGIDSGRVVFTDLAGMPVLSSAPTDVPDDGTLRLFDDGVDRRIYVFLKGVWRYTTLT